jgi:hypothetical protein
LGLSQPCGWAQITLNVKDYGAKGDAVQFYVNTVSNSVVVTTTNQFSGADIGKTIEVFRVGKPTYGKNSYGVITNDNQDLIAVITNVVDGTNLYLNVLPHGGTNLVFLPQVTMDHVWATCGTDNTLAFSNTIFAASGYTNAVIYIPNGRYLLMPVKRVGSDGYGYGAISIHRGGMHFIGESRDGTVLLSRGAWQNYGNQPAPYRSFLIEIVAPITNDFPLVFDNMTWDGGVQNGYISAGNAIGYANPVDGLGWDPKHGAYLTFDSRNNSGTATHQVLTNLTVIHWRGEMIKSIDGNTNGNIEIKNCAFGDGSATALNIYPAWDVENNVFSNLFQIAELYQQYYQSPGRFCMNLATNIFANGFAFNGATPNTKPFLMQSNEFYFSGVGYNAFMTMPGKNISFLDNKIHCANYMTVFNLGAPGAQGSITNENILISGNIIDAPKSITSCFSYGGPGINGVINLTISSNTVTAPQQIFSIVSAGGNASNVDMHDNKFICPMTQMKVGLPGLGNTPFTLFPSNNIYTSFPLYYSTPTNHFISYSSGPEQRMDYVATDSAFILKDSEASQIPAGAYFDFDNRSNRWASLNRGMGGDIVIYPSERMDSSVVLPYGRNMTFYWNGKGWATNAQINGTSSKPVPPTSLRIMN